MRKRETANRNDAVLRYQFLKHSLVLLIMLYYGAQIVPFNVTMLILNHFSQQDEFSSVTSQVSVMFKLSVMMLKLSVISLYRNRSSLTALVPLEKSFSLMCNINFFLFSFKMSFN